MKKYILILVLIYPIILSSQTNRYFKPTQGEFINYHVSPDWNVLIKIAKAQNELKRARLLSKMQQTVNQYNSFTYYPEKIENGWHHAVIMNNFDYWNEAKVFVDSNTISKLYIDDFMEKEIIFSGNINKGYSIIKIESPNNVNSGYLDAFFIEHIANPNVKTSAPQLDNLGTVCFWTNISNTNIDLYFNDNYVGCLASYFKKGPPTCEEKGTLNFKYKQGTYKFRASSKDKTWEGTITVLPNECIMHCFSPQIYSVRNRR